MRLSVVLVTGSQRERAQRVVDAVATQTAVGEIELVVVDLAPSNLPQLHVSEPLQSVYLKRPDIARWGIARSEGVRAASGDAVAFIEDHCFPEPEWAETLIDAHTNAFGVIGYAFKSGNPESFVARASLLGRYGNFVHPAHRQQASIVSGNNVSYKRDLLLSFGDALEDLLTIDFNLQEILAKRGVPLFVESRALAAHEHFTSVVREGITGHHYCRLLAAKRAQTQSWSWARKVLHGIGAPLGSPVIRMWRLLHGLKGRRALWPSAIRALPVITVEYLFDSVGESLGYLIGAGDAERWALHWELEASRSGK
ncbi:MAG TPA: glycosyltransferase [Gemmatimonadaceae bacterium]|nr:glycosyltransferase [Gemmatimonadaceae bacterium]